METDLLLPHFWLQVYDLPERKISFDAQPYPSGKDISC